uniref:HMG box domain-containing protein n=1 Tax=Arundo donax TaxID=35708 RepID=A0A0A9DBT0_ARUDO
MQEIGRACGEKWNTMTFEEKVKYYDIATEKRAEFEKAMVEYKRTVEKCQRNQMKTRIVCSKFLMVHRNWMNRSTVYFRTALCNF